jgi:hypothetical protein
MPKGITASICIKNDNAGSEYVYTYGGGARQEW